MKRILSAYYSLSLQCSQWVSDDEAYIISVLFTEPPVLTVSQWWWSVYYQRIIHWAASAHGESVMMKRILLAYYSLSLQCSQWVSDDEAYIISVLFTEPPVLTVSQWWWSVYDQRIIHWAASAQGESVMMKRILLAYYSLSLQCSKWVGDDEAYIISVLFTEPPVLTVSQWWWSVYYQRIIHWASSAHGESVMMKRILSAYYSLSRQCSRWVSDDEAYIISVLFTEPPVLTVSQWWWSVYYQRIIHWASSAHGESVMMKRILSAYYSLSRQCSQWVSDDEAYIISVLFTEPPVLTVSQWWWSVYDQRIIHWAASAHGESVMMKHILLAYYSLSLQCSKWVGDDEAYIISVLFTEPPVLTVSQWWWSVYYQRIIHWASSAHGESVMMKRILSAYYSLSLQCTRWVSDDEAYIISVLFTEPPVLTVSQWWWSVYY